MARHDARVALQHLKVADAALNEPMTPSIRAA
jgi:hypothetical protein